MTDLENGKGASDDAAKKVSTTTSEVENILLYKNKFMLLLEERFRDAYDVTEREAKGNLKICVLAKGMEKKTQEQIIITITKTGKINVNLNPYDHYDEYYFVAENLTYEEVKNEMDNFASFLQAGKVSEGSKLIKETYPGADMDMSAYMTKK